MGDALSLGMATLGGIPVSTTHTITGAIVGVRTAQDVKAVRLGRHLQPGRGRPGC